MRIRTTTFVMALAAAAGLATAEDERPREMHAFCPDWALQPCAVGPQHERREHREPQRVWDPNLAQWRTEHPREVWDPNLARYRLESRREVWDPYLAQYRPRDARRDPPPPERQPDTRHRHPGRSDWCFARH